MDLGSVFSAVSEKLSGNKDEPGSYLAVKISSTSIIATVWLVSEGKVIVGDVGSADIGDDSWDSLLHATDQAVSSALNDQTIASAKTVFAVPHSWVSDGKILPDHLRNLRQLCKELDLSPQGFVVVSEALENYYKEIEGAPLTAILVGIEGLQSTMTLYRAGKNLGTTVLPLEQFSPDSIPIAIEKSLKNFTAIEVLPSRIIIYDGKGDLNPIADKLTAHPWTKQLPFLHFPKVEIADASLVVKAVAIAGGVQLGGKFEVDATPTPDPTPELEEVSLQEAGFASNEPGEEISITTAEPKSSSKKSFGQLEEISSVVPPEEAKAKLPPLKLDLKPRLDEFKSLFGKTLAKILPHRGEPGPKTKPKNFAIMVILVVLLIIVAAGATAYFVPKTTVIAKVSPKSFDQEMDVTVVTDSSKAPATSSGVLVGSFIETQEIGTKKGVASGKKLVGDKAKGSVTVYGVSSAKTFTTDTTIVSPNGLKFTLDHEVSVASGDAITPATITTSITASDIGESYNLPSGTKFAIGNLPSSSYLAKNDSAISGGNSHQATVVTKDDQDRLMATLSAQLSDKARGDLQSKVESDQNLLPNAITSTVSKKKFSKDVDSEADTVSLDLTVAFRGVVFSQSDLIALFTQKFAANIPAGFSLLPGNAKVEVKSAKNDKSGNTILTVRLSAPLLPDVDKVELTKKISGKSQASATTILNMIPNISQVSFETKPRILEGVTKFYLPGRLENIKIEIVSE